MSNDSTANVLVPNETGENVFKLCNGNHSVTQIAGIIRKNYLTNPASNDGPNTISYDVLGFIASSWYAGLISLKVAEHLDRELFSTKETAFLSNFSVGKGCAFSEVIATMNMDPTSVDQLVKFPFYLLLSCLIKSGLLPIK